MVCGAENKTKKLQREIHVAGKQENSKMEMIMALGKTAIPNRLVAFIHKQFLCCGHGEAWKQSLKILLC